MLSADMTMGKKMKKKIDKYIMIVKLKKKNI